jgi:four helix bundle protein
MAITSFKDLTVWQKSFSLVKDVYTLSRQLPRAEQFGLTSQVRRSAISIPSNIAEGTKRGSRKDYIQFLRVAHGSSAELETQLLLMQSLYTIDAVGELKLLNEIQKMLQSLIKKLQTDT